MSHVPSYLIRSVYGPSRPTQLTFHTLGSRLAVVTSRSSCNHGIRGSMAEPPPVDPASWPLASRRHNVDARFHRLGTRPPLHRLASSPPLCCTSSCGCILNEAKQDESRGANDRSNVTCSASQGCTAGAPDELRFVATPARRTALAPGMKEMHPTELQSDSCDPSLGALDNTSTTQPHAYHARLGCILRS